MMKKKRKPIEYSEILKMSREQLVLMRKSQIKQIERQIFILKHHGIRTSPAIFKYRNRKPPREQDSLDVLRSDVYFYDKIITNKTLTIAGFREFKNNTLRNLDINEKVTNTKFSDFLDGIDMLNELDPRLAEKTDYYLYKEVYKRLFKNMRKMSLDEAVIKTYMQINDIEIKLRTREKERNKRHEKDLYNAIFHNFDEEETDNPIYDEVRKFYRRRGML